VSDQPPATAPAAQTFRANDLGAWRTAYASITPLLVHLNGDTTWLLQLPVPPSPSTSATTTTTRSHFNVLLDPWLQGPQSDVASWFSTQWHIVAPTVKTIAELQNILRQLEHDDNDGNNDDKTSSYIDAVTISHEFTDHCHEATLRELPATTPVFATDKAAALIRSWKHFDTVVTTPDYSITSSVSSSDGTAAAAALGDWHNVLSVKPLPPWLGIGRVVTPGNSLYYHSAVMIVFDRASPSTPRTTNTTSPTALPLSPPPPAEAVLYSPHGIKASDLAGIASHPAIDTLALLHGLHDVRIWMTKQLNLGAHNGLEAVRACGARYWVATHDEVKSGGGFIAPLLRRVQYTVADAVGGTAPAATDGSAAGEDEDKYQFVELGSGDGLVL
ncbi:hypothetical protein Micbo1qcDRAFT_111143, partial [Microdochium bolleyi]